MMKKMWMIRAGRSAALVQDFEDQHYVAVGWIEMGDLSNIDTRENLEKVFDASYPNAKKSKKAMSLGQIARFKFEIKPGDSVITYNPEYRYYLVGEILSDYVYRADSPGDYNHIREVKWLGKVNRDVLSVATKNTVGAIMTLFLLNDTAASEFTNLLSGKAPLKIQDESETEGSDLDEIRKDTIERAFEFIKDNIQKLDWDEIQQLVAGILRAMGYKTKVAAPGPDRGTDIIASPDGLGLEEPRIRVEVKHRNESIGAPILRSFIGGLRAKDRGLFVSTGGFTREARYEAERSTVPVTLIDIDELANLLIQNYDSADIETRTLIPLVKVYWPTN